TDIDTSLTLVQNAASSALSQLPAGSQAQGVNVKKVSPNILLVASLYSDDDRFDEIFLSNYGIINLQNPLTRLPGVGQVRIFGAGPYSMRVWLDPKRLQTFGLTTADALAAIQGQTVQVVAGQLGGPPVPPDQPFQFTINALGRLSDASQFEDIIIKSTTGTAAQIVRLRDVARVDLSQQSFSNYSRFTGHKSTQILVFGRRSGGRGGSGADESCRLRAHRGHAGARQRPRDRGHGVRLRCFLPLPRRARRGGGGGGERGDPSWRLAAGRGSREGRRRARAGPGGVRDPAFQPLGRTRRRRSGMAQPERVFPLRELTRLLRLTPKRAGQLKRLGLVRSDATGYRFRELVAARVASALLEGGATVRQVREALDGARRLAPEAETPLAELRLVVQDQRIVVEQDRLRLDPRTGQTLLDFERADLERETRESLLTGLVRPLIPPSDAAEIWFARASAWDGEPERWEAAVEAYE